MISGPAKRLFSSASMAGRLGLRGLAERTELAGQHVLVRVDFNCPMDKADASGSTIADDTRIRAALPTITYLREQGAKIVLCSHSGRPKGAVNDAMRLTAVGARLADLLGTDVTKLDDCVGPEVEASVRAMSDADVTLLENVRFHPGEEKNDAEFVQQLATASCASIYVNDAFGTAHRAHASTEGVAHHMAHAAAGLLMEKELAFLVSAVEEPVRPLAAVVGGAKVSTKLPVLRTLLDKVDMLILGGGMIFTFFQAQGLGVGTSVVEEDLVEEAKQLLALAKEKGVDMILPSDVVVADSFDAGASSNIVDVGSIPDGWMGLDIGPASVVVNDEALRNAETIIWNGPMGVFEFDRFANGTVSMAETLAERSAAGGVTIIGGGDSVAAVEKAGVADVMSHISTGGGASLELLEGKHLPGVVVLHGV